MFARRSDYPMSLDRPYRRALMPLQMKLCLFLLTGWLGGCAPIASSPTEPRSGLIQLPLLGGRQAAIYFFTISVADGSVRELPKDQVPKWDEFSRRNSAGLELRYLPDGELGPIRWSLNLGDILLLAMLKPAELQGTDARTRLPLWRRNTDPWLRLVTDRWPRWAGANSEGVVYLKTLDAVCALDPRSGNLLWTAPASGTSGCFLTSDSLLDSWIEKQTVADQPPETLLKIVRRDASSGRTLALWQLPRFQGLYDQATVVIKRRTDNSYVAGLLFVVHD